MKPTKLYCQYCELYPCSRTECHRKLVFRNRKIIMEEPIIYNKIRVQERKREYFSVPLRKNEY